MIYRSKRILISFLCLSINIFTLSYAGIEDYSIKVTANDSIGNFDMYSFQGQIVGVAYLSNSEVPDIFVKSSASYPDFSRYKCIGRNNEGTPIFGEKITVTLPSNTPKDIFPSYIFQSQDKKVHLVWWHSGSIRYAIYEEKNNRFVEKKTINYGTTPNQLTAYMGSDNRLHVILSHTSQSGSGVSVDGLGKYNGDGIYRGRFSYAALYEISFSGYLDGSASTKRMVTFTDKDVYSNHKSMGTIVLNQMRADCLIAGSHFGEIGYYENVGSVAMPQYQNRKPIVNAQGEIIRHPAISPYPIAYPNPNGVFCDIIASSEGGLYYYKFTGSFSSNGNPIYEDPVNVLQKGGNLNGGSLVVPSIVDWDNDGAMDIISGNSQGFIYFFKNHGDNVNFAFSTPEILKYNDGEQIQIQGGYGESTQGPGESRWGYVSPNVIDWDVDGYLDILFGDARSKHMIIRGGPLGLEDEESLYLNGLNFHGNWRDRPGIAAVGDSIIYITLDEDNNIHLYKKADTNNLIDAGKLKLLNGDFISSNRGIINAYNETGRAKFDIVDWDSDGLLDLLVGTSGFMAIPNPSIGQPEQGDKKANVLFFKNVGTNMQPRYLSPVALTHKGEKMNFGWHECGVVATKLGGYGKLNLIVGDERGRFYFFENKNLSNTEIKYLGVPIEVFSEVKLPVRIVSNNVKIYLDQDYKFYDDVGAFSENRFTQIETINTTPFYVKPKFTGLIYIATTAGTLPVEYREEWKKVDYFDLKYGLNSNSTQKYTIYCKESREGEKVYIPQIGALGTFVLSSSITEGELDTFIPEVKSPSKSYKIYPNPTRSLIKVDALAENALENEDVKIKICTALGMVVYHDLLKTNDIIDVSFFEKGIYIINVGSESFKLIKD